ncbi:unnamed protein product, partial [Didymodactylos carnosus]
MSKAPLFNHVSSYNMIVSPNAPSDDKRYLPPGIGNGYQAYSRQFQSIVTKFSLLNYQNNSSEYGLYSQFGNEQYWNFFYYFNSPETSEICNRIQIPKPSYDPFCLLNLSNVEYTGIVLVGNETLQVFLQQQPPINDTWWISSSCVPIREIFNYGALVTYYNHQYNPSGEYFKLPHACSEIHITNDTTTI